MHPVVKTLKPSLYVKYTGHLPRAMPFTYNYSVIDDYIKEHYYSKTRRQIADDLNEPVDRVTYRIQALKAEDVIIGKREKKALEDKQLELILVQMVVDMELEANSERLSMA